MPAKDPRSWVESPSADRMQGSSDISEDLDADSNEPSSDQDIDTAGTDADDESPTKAMGTGLAEKRSRG